MTRPGDAVLPLALLAGLLMLAFAWFSTEHPGPQPQGSVLDVPLAAQAPRLQVELGGRVTSVEVRP